VGSCCGHRQPGGSGDHPALPLPPPASFRRPPAPFAVGSTPAIVAAAASHSGRSAPTDPPTGALPSSAVGLRRGTVVDSGTVPAATCSLLPPPPPPTSLRHPPPPSAVGSTPVVDSAASSHSCRSRPFLSSNRGSTIFFYWQAGAGDRFLLRHAARSLLPPRSDVLPRPPLSPPPQSPPPLDASVPSIAIAAQALAPRQNGGFTVCCFLLLASVGGIGRSDPHC